MRLRCSSATALGLLALAAGLLGSRPRQEPEAFAHDPAGRVLGAAWTAAENAYAAALEAGADGSLDLAWLSFEEGAGDHLHAARWHPGEGTPGAPEPVPASRLRRGPARLDTPCPDAAGGLSWLEDHGGPAEPAWAFHRLGPEGGEFRIDLGLAARALRVSARPGGAWAAAFQTAAPPFPGAAPGFRIGLLRGDPGTEPEYRILPPAGSWCPDLLLREDALWVVWDRQEARGHRILGQRWSARGPLEALGPIRVLAASEGFLGRPRLASAPGGGVFVAFEEGPPAWGGVFRGRNRLWNNATDERGPLHRWSRLRLLRWDPTGDLAEPRDPVPQPGFAAQARVPGRRPGARRLGVFYERPHPVTDAAGRLWLVYRHYRATQLACAEATRHHIESGWQIYARCLDAGGWGEAVLLGPEHPQRDGAQRLEAAALEDGVAVLWDFGRTDRRTPQLRTGIAAAVCRSPVLAGPPEAFRPLGVAPEAVLEDTAPEPRTLTGQGREWTLAFGDLHRHTDLSLCFPFFDGCLEDAWRYGIEGAGLDFMAVTDHARDLAGGRAESLVWWRAVKTVRQMEIPGRFRPFHGYERSHRDTDHNVISLRTDMLRPYPPPLPEFWKELDGDTFTIPHQPFIGRVWEVRDDTRRPLAEVYQGCRDEARLQDLERGWRAGHRFGVIASSDHMSTRASFAGVWTEDRSRQGLFRALQARRTFGATDRILLAFHAAGAWMGEETFWEEKTIPLRLRWEGTAPVARLRLLADGEELQVWEEPGRAGDLEVQLPWPEGAKAVRLLLLLEQADGGRAWSSPVWVERPEEGAGLSPAGRPGGRRR